MTDLLRSPTLKEGFSSTARVVLDYVSMRRNVHALKEIVVPGDGRPVLLIPGFACNDYTTRPLRRFLKGIGYYVHGWHGGINCGPSETTLEHLRCRLDALSRQHNQKIIIIGHSLGGIYARELARCYPDKVAQVITLGSPFGSGLYPESIAPRIRRLFALVNGSDNRLFTDPSLARIGLQPLPVPSTAIYTPRDGVVNWRTCINPRGERAENIEVDSSHLGLILTPMVMVALADRLAQKPENWQPFDRAKHQDHGFNLAQVHDEYEVPVPPLDGLTGPSLFA